MAKAQDGLDTLGSLRGADERRERLAYLADLTLELKEMADREGCAVLSALLSLSHAEALRQAGATREFA